MNLITILKAIVLSAAIAACTGIFCNANAAVPADTSDPSYRDGARARDVWENWYGTLSGSFRGGADYYATWRSKPAQLMPCALAAGDDTSFRDGCLRAQAFFRPVDARRMTDAQYWNGWNKRVPYQFGIPGEITVPGGTSAYPATSYAPPVRPSRDYSTPETAMNSCAADIRDQGFSIDVYYDPNARIFHHRALAADRFAWQKCMTLHGQSLTQTQVDGD